MLIHNYWEKVLGSRVKIKLLRVLCRYPHKKFTIRELSRLMHTAHTPVLKSLPDLQEMNLISMEKHGTANMLFFNTKSILFPILGLLFRNEAGTKLELKKELAKSLPQAKMIALFGSIPAEMETASSDIDLLVVSNNKRETEKAIEVLRKEITERFGNLLSPNILTEAGFKSKRNLPFAKDLIKHYEIVSGQDLIEKWWVHDKNEKRKQRAV